jgi:membrane protein
MLESISSYIRLKVTAWIHKVYHHPFIYPFLDPVYTIIKNTIQSYNKHQVFRLGAALAYYTIFSLPALIIVIIGLVGFFLGEAAVRGEVYANLVESLGTDAAQQIQDAVINIGTPDTNWWATVLGVGLLIFVATGVFYALQDALNHIFEVESVPKRVKILEVIINRVLSFGMVLSIGGLLVISILFNALLLKISDFVSNNEALVYDKVPDFIVPYLQLLTDHFLVFLNLGLSIFLIALFFAALYRILPAVKLKWGYIWAGAFFSSILFWLGEMSMGWYLSRTSIISAYGAAGSLIVVLIWVSYSAQLIFLGAEFIIALSGYRGDEILPKKFAVLLHKVKKKKKKESREELGDYSLHHAPPSHDRIQRYQVFDYNPETTNEETTSLGFNKDKNIDLTDDELDE